MTTILVVEDVKVNAMLISAALEHLDATLYFAVNGVEAIEMFEQHDIDLILMDLHLPQMNGFDAVDRIRESERYRQRNIPIIAITANALMEEKTQFLKSTGLADYITKPIRKDTLVNAVLKHLPQHEPKARTINLA